MDNETKSMKVELVERLDAYPPKLSEDEYKSSQYNRYFNFPSRVFDMKEFDANDYTVLSVVCYLANGFFEGKSTTVPTNHKIINDVLGLGTRENVKTQKTISKWVENDVLSVSNEINGLQVYEVNLGLRYSKINSHEFEKILQEKNSQRKKSLAAIYLALNTYMYKMNGKDHSYVCYQGMATIANKVNMANSTAYRAVDNLHDMKVIAKYTVALRGTKSRNMNTVLSCYVHRDILRRYVEGQVRSKSGKYCYVFKHGETETKGLKQKEKHN